MRLTIVGPGRAGGAIALAAREAGHQIVGVLSRSPDTRYGPALEWDHTIPESDVLLISVRDDAIAEVAARLAPRASSVSVAAHMSGFTPITALDAFDRSGVTRGGFHPLQTLPDPGRGAAALPGSFVGIGGSGRASESLNSLAISLGMHPFPLPDQARPGYHAGASAAANFVITALATASDLMRHSSVDPAVTRPLVERAVANLYETGPEAALTGPIARGDVATVTGQLEAAERVSDEVGEQYRLMARATAIRAHRREDAEKWS